MVIRRVPEITAGQENARLVPFVPGTQVFTLKKDPVEPVPPGTLVALIFRVEGYDQDCDGSLMARLGRIHADGGETGWHPTALSLSPDCTWVIDSPGELDNAATLTSQEGQS